MLMYDMNSVEDSPAGFGSESCTEDEMVDYLTEVAIRVVSEVWMATPMEDVEQVLKASPDGSEQEEDYTQWCCKQGTCQGRSSSS